MAGLTRPPQNRTAAVGQTSSGAKAAAMTRNTMAKPTLQKPTLRESVTPTGSVSATKAKTVTAPAAPPAPQQQTQTFNRGGKVKPPVKPKKR